MKYCEKCGTLLVMKKCHNEGLVPYCGHCHEFRFPTFSSAISTVIFNKTRDKILLIQQYGRKDNILVAGYINKGENAKEALIREIKEEVGINVKEYYYNDNEYFEKTNTLIHNYIVIAENEDFILNDEVDKAKWYNKDEILDVIKPCSLAKHFLVLALHRMEEL